MDDLMDICFQSQVEPRWDMGKDGQALLWDLAREEIRITPYSTMGFVYSERVKTTGVTKLGLHKTKEEVFNYLSAKFTN